MMDRHGSYSKQTTQVTKTRTVVSELSLYGSVAHFFKQRGCHVKLNTPQGDVLCYNPHRDLLISVEVKRNDARDALGQVLTYGDFADVTYVALPDVAVPRIELLERLGIGLLIIQPNGKFFVVHERLAPRINCAANRTLRAKLINKIMPQAFWWRNVGDPRTKSMHVDFSAEEVMQVRDVCKIVFQRKKAQVACRLFLNWLKSRRGHWASKSAIREFSISLQKGLIWQNKRFTYSQRNFYLVILRNLIRIGLLMRNKPRTDERTGKMLFGYGPTEMFIPKEPPKGSGFYRICWYIAKYWAKEFP